MIDVHKKHELFSLDKLFFAWRKFRSGKSAKYDVQAFERNLEDNIFSLGGELQDNGYTHSPYRHFLVFDNKKRDIHKAEVKDRVVHQLLYDYLVKIYEPFFIADSYASRKEKGTHKAIRTLSHFIKLSGENSFVLKCDIRKYFDSIDHAILFSRLKERVNDEKILSVAKEIIGSFGSVNGKGKGVPLGNVTSQIFANIYLNALDHFVKKKLHARFYVRYNDDFVIVERDKKRLEAFQIAVQKFTEEFLLLSIPDTKTSIRKVRWGVDFLGSNILPEAILLRGKTKAKVLGEINEKNINSKIGILKHGNFFHLRQKLLSRWHEKSDLLE